MEQKLPKGWEVKNLGEVCIFIGGGTPSKANKDYWNGNIPWASIKDIKNQYLSSTHDFISEKGLNNSATNIAEPNEIILATRINPGRPIITKIRTSINQDLKIVKPKIEIDAFFLYYLFLNIEKDILKLSNGTTVLGITLSTLNDIRVQIPPLPTQQSIVSKIEELFSELDKGIEDLKTAHAQLKVYRQSVLKWAFEGTKLLDFDRIVVTSQNGLSKRSGSEGIEYKVLRLADIDNESISNRNARKIRMTSAEVDRYALKENELICIRVNGSKDLVGKMIFVSSKDQFDQWAFCDHFIRFTLNRQNSAKFMSYYFQSLKVRKYIHHNMVTSAGQNTVSQGTIKGVQIPSCSFESQEKIVQEIESRLSVADKMEESIKESLLKAEALRQSILRKAFRGELV